MCRFRFRFQAFQENILDFKRKIKPFFFACLLARMHADWSQPSLVHITLLVHAVVEQPQHKDGDEAEGEAPGGAGSHQVVRRTASAVEDEKRQDEDSDVHELAPPLSPSKNKGRTLASNARELGVWIRRKRAREKHKKCRLLQGKACVRQ